MKHILSYLRHILCIVLTAVMPGLSSCRDENEMPVTGQEEFSPVKLSFRLITATEPGTRTDAADESEGADTENVINTDDVSCLLFDKDANFLADMKAETTTVSVGEAFTVYEVTASVTDPYFRNNEEHNVEFYILTLVNHSGWGVTLPKLKAGQSIDAIFGDGIRMSVLPATDRLQSEGNDRQYFPMAGLQKFTIPGNMLMITWDGLPYDITRATGNSVRLLRALAKIEIVDRIGSDSDPLNGNTPINIESVSLNGYMTDGLLIPDKSNWYYDNILGTRQVESASVTSSSSYLYTAEALPFFTDQAASDERSDKCPVFSAYIYEYTGRILDDTSLAPYVTIEFGESRNPDTGKVEIEKCSYTLDLTGYGASMPGQSAGAILRNHIYRYEISGVQALPSVSMEVCPMDKTSAEIVFN